MSLPHIISASVEINKKPLKHDFSFDQVFAPNSEQQDIFELVSPLVQSALDGYNVCIFAYGQTGEFHQKNVSFFSTSFEKFQFPFNKIALHRNAFEQAVEKHSRWTV